uniref:Striatin domain-containing protein n=1 Tax=Anisakis simplex TaxID=6269 RepID=A0A0M3J9X8_ANISI
LECEIERRRTSHDQLLLSERLQRCGLMDDAHYYQDYCQDSEQVCEKNPLRESGGASWREAELLSEGLFLKRWNAPTVPITTTAQ